MKHSWATLFLCFSLSLPLLSAAQSPSSHSPWLNNTQKPTAPLQFQQPAQGTLRDFGLMAPPQAPMPWAQELRDNRTKEVTQGSEVANSTIDFDLQVFISAGMPEGVLRSLFRQALDEGGKRVDQEVLHDR